MNVVIVDDEAIVRHGIRHAVDWTALGADQVEEASNGREVLEHWHEWKPELLVTDIKMPVMDGISLIREVKKRDPGCICIVLSCADEFELVKEALLLGASDYLLKMTVRPEELMTCIRNAANRRTIEWSRSTRSRHDTLSESAMLYGLRPGLERFALAVMQVNPCIASRHRAILEISLLLEEEKSVELDLFQAEEGELALLFDCMPGESVHDCLSRVKSRLQRIGEHVVKRTGHEIRFGVSDFCESPSRLRTAYAEAKTAANDQFFSAADGIRCYSDCRKEPSAEADDQIRAMFNHSFRTSLIQALLTGTEEEAAQTVHRCFELLNRSHCSLAAAYDCVDKAASILRVAVMELSALAGGAVYEALESFDGQAFQLQWSCQRTAERMKDYCRYIFRTRSNLQGRSGSKIVHEVQCYLMSHYREKVSLESTAARFFLNKNYLSQLFKAETGTNFIRYLNAIRIEKAKELIVNTAETIHDIAEQTGFGDFRYFSRVFRNHTGLSPTEFKTTRCCK
ncbi:response regulator [Paenibacillus spongiae]|uniref:Response regulator n=1 Tax=Paenibacillus spongiae TaxID=2909671 RepID=A0ABY5SH61_9BACL|nr:helix-turn-helix domain-containing protein [Paenibacillus spongiae]UVI32999.1 response regulator [Paenibacillus spongiae]